MSRVYLFADFGKGPRCYLPVRTIPAGEPLSNGDIDHETDTYEPTPRQDRARSTARRWWLVECESAEHGRAIIRDRYIDDYPGRRAECERAILDSGGAA